MTGGVVTFEQAKICPRCGKPGEEGKSVPVSAPRVPRGTRVVFVWCRTVVCPWYATSWPIQVYHDGTVREHDHSRDEKEYRVLPNFDARSQAVLDAVEAQVAMERRGDGEIRNG